MLYWLRLVRLFGEQVINIVRNRKKRLILERFLAYGIYVSVRRTGVMRKMDKYDRN